MDAWQSAVNVAAIIAGLVVLAGLVVRRRVGWAYFFALYLLLVTGYGVVVAVRPDLVVWRAWAVKELTLALVALLAGLEVGVRLFARRAGARPHAGRAVLAAMAFTLVFLLVDLPGPRAANARHTSALDVVAFEQALSLLPRLAYGSTWLFAALWLVAHSFAIPLTKLHETVLLGLFAYSFVLGVSLGVLDSPSYARATSHLLTLTFLAVLVLWAWAAWRPEPAPRGASAEVVRQVWWWL